MESMTVRQSDADADFWAKRREPREPVSLPWRRISAAVVSTLLGLAVFWGVGYLFASRFAGEDDWVRIESSLLYYSFVTVVGFGIMFVGVLLTTATYTFIVDGKRGLRLLPFRGRRS